MPPPRATNASRPTDRFRTAQALHQRGRLTEAEAIYQDILRQRPNHADALHFLGVIALQTGRTERGVQLISKAVDLKPQYAEALTNLGIGYAELRRHLDALACYDRALALKPDFAEAHDNRGTVLRDLGRPAEALASYEAAIALRPGFVEAISNRGNALHDLRRYEDALASHDAAIALQPAFLEAHCNRGITLRALGRHDEALASFDAAIKLQPNNVDVHNSRGNTLRDLHRSEDARAAFAKAVTLNPNHAEAHNNLGNALQDLQQHQDALPSYAQAIALNPVYAEAHYNRGNALLALQRYREALTNYDRAVALKPDYADAYYNRGNTLMALERPEDALASYDTVVALRPDHAGAYYNRGTALRLRRRYAAALASYENAQALNPLTPSLLGDILFTQRQICQWIPDETLFDAMLEGIGQGRETTPPFPMLALSNSAPLQRKAAAIFVGNRHAAGVSLPALSRHPEHPRIRIGYFSADFRDHAMMHLLIDMFACHDRSKFELTAFSFGPDTGDEMRRRVVSVFDRFVDVRSLPDREVALAARRLEIDIAVDLMGFTTGSRTGIFSSRAAPIQVNYLGYPGTMGAAYYDYIIADRIVVPQPDTTNFSEKIAYLPDTYQPNERSRAMSSRSPTRTEQGLPETGFVYCCFNNNFKLTPLVFDSWMRILRAVEHSVLWLLEDNTDATTNLRTHAASRGVDPHRLIFARRIPFAEHLARHRLADLFLDTLPYNAHTTASDALWTGLPVLTCIGETFAGRVAASLLQAVGLPDLITTTPQAYEALACDLAAHPGRLAQIKGRLQANRLNTPLFDIDRFTRNIEAAFLHMYEHLRAVP